MASGMASSLALHNYADTMEESWEDDLGFADLDGIAPQQPASPAYSRASGDYYRRESVCSSRLSMVSGFELESSDEQHVPHNRSPKAAIAAAARAGIPIPDNVPSSALIGGTIKRLGSNTRGRRTLTQDDWGDDLEFPNQDAALNLKEQEFPDSLQQLLENVKSRGSSPSRGQLGRPSQAARLSMFRDTEDDDDDFFGEIQDLPPLKTASTRLQPNTASRPSLITPPLSEAHNRDENESDDDFENDFELPGNAPLKLNLRHGGRPANASIAESTFEDWGEADSGVGSSYYGSHYHRQEIPHDGRSTSMSVLAPSISGTTLESEEEDLDGLELPEDLPDLRELLERRKESFATPLPKYHVQKDLDDPDEEFFDGLEIESDAVFDQSRLMRRQNAKNKTPPRKQSPVRRSAGSLGFTQNNSASQRPSQTTQPPSPHRHRSRHSQGPSLLPPLQILEPVVERESREPQEEQQPQPAAPPRRSARSRWSSGPTLSDNRWGGNESRPPVPPIPTSRLEREQPSAKKVPGRVMRNENREPTTTSAQLLRAKRSMPNITKNGNASPSRTGRAVGSSVAPVPPPPTKRPSTATRPSSRSSSGRPTSSGRPSSSSNSISRPTSSGGRPSSGASARPASRSSTGRPPSQTDVRPKSSHNNVKSFRHPAPFVPAGTSARDSANIAAKFGRPHTEQRSSRLLQRTPAAHHSPSPSLTNNSSTSRRGSTPKVAPEHLRREAAAIGQLTRPTRKRNFGDGTELDGFDDLPLNAVQEANLKPVKGTSGSRPLTGTRQKSASIDETSKKKHTRTTSDNEVPSWARDTAASRRAREYTQQRLANADAERKNAGRPASSHHRKKSSVSQQKPHLIRPMGNINTLPREAAANGMTYNPKTMKWEGNERELAAFDAPAEPRSSPPRQPALITKVGHSGGKAGVQVVGGMVFDPVRMCWLKVDEDPDDESDPFEGVDEIPDDVLSVDTHSAPGIPGGGSSIIMGVASSISGSGGASSAGRLPGAFGEFVVGEEFDVGPQFQKRQREEEDRWKQVVAGWITTNAGPKEENHWLYEELMQAQIPRLR